MNKLLILQKINIKKAITDYAKKWIEEEYRIDLPPLRLEK